MTQDDNPYIYHLCKQCNPEEITELSKIVFVEGHLDRVDDLLLAILPLANIVYYKNIKYLDDREYAREDLISDAVLRLYQDITLRWDKYIHIDSYYEYYSSLLRNSMIKLVHEYHNHYNQEELDNEDYVNADQEAYAYEYVEWKLLKESVLNNIDNIARRILRCRQKNTKLLLAIYDCMYIKKSGLESLRSQVKVLGITTQLFNFYCEHVIYVYRLSYNYQYAILGGRSNMVTRISGTIDRFEDLTYKILSVNYYDSIIPEIYAEFGAETAKQFVKLFSGRTVQVPNYRDFCDDLLGGVVVALAKGDRENLSRVAEDYNIPYRTILRMFNKAMKFEGIMEGSTDGEDTRSM